MDSASELLFFFLVDYLSFLLLDKKDDIMYASKGTEMVRDYGQLGEAG